MATIGSAKATLVNKIDTLTASATAKDTIYLAKALKENTTHHSFTFQGAWAATTAYALDDVVTTSGKTYICIVAHTSGASFAVGSNWSLMAEKGTNGTDGTDLTSTLTTAGDVVYKGASALTRLAKGTADQVLTMNSGATAPEWADAAGGGKVLQVVSNRTKTYIATTSTSFVATGLFVDITPASTSSKILVSITGGGQYNGSSSSISQFVTIFRGSTNIGDATYGITRFATPGGNWMIVPHSATALDSPASVASVRYEAYFMNRNTANSVQFSDSDRGLVTITAMEIAG